MPLRPLRRPALARAILLLLVAGLALTQGPTVRLYADDQPSTASPALQYPVARLGDQVDNYHGILVADPYRWLEDPQSDETQAWVNAEADLADGYLGAIPGRTAIGRHYNSLLDYERYSIPYKRGQHYFYYWNDLTHQQSPLFTTDDLAAKPRLLINPDSFSRDGSVAIAGTSATADGALIAYGLSMGGSDYREYHVRDVATGRDWPDVVRLVRNTGVSWSHDEQGFYYTRTPMPDAGQTDTPASQVYYHRLGSDQSADTLIYSRPDHPEWFYGAFETEDGRYLLISISLGTGFKTILLYRDLQAPGSDFQTLAGRLEAGYAYVGNDGAKFWLYTNKDAPNFRVISLDLAQPGRLQDVIPQGADALEFAGMAGDQILADYLHDAHDVVNVYGKDGSFVRPLPLPDLATLNGLGGPRNESERFFQLTTFVSPGTIYGYDTVSGKTSIFRNLQTIAKADDFITEQVFYSSKDGTRVPMFVVHRKDLVLDGSNPTLLYGYGGFGITETPFYNSSNVTWLELGGVFALPNIRGGGEYGEAWHQAGEGLYKQNVFDDFIAAAGYLVSAGYTSPSKLGIWGISNGGLLVGACLTQRPDLFGAAVADSGVLDMLRFQLFTIGRAWVPEYGSSDDPALFPTLYSYSPLHNVRAGTVYPPTLIMAGQNDDRVVPAHSYKFAAALQIAQAGTAPILLRIERQSGHGAGTPPQRAFLATLDRLAFLTQALGATVPGDW